MPRILPYRVSRGNKSKGRPTVLIAAAVWIAAMIGLTAVASDMGAVCHAKGQLQRTANAAAMAAACRLTAADNSSTAIYNAALTAVQRNHIDNLTPTVGESDIVLGRSLADGSGKYAFQEGVPPYNAVKVTVRLPNNSPNGAVPPLFASAIAMLVPRDIAVVIDLSRSMNYDSQLRHEKTAVINIDQVWRDLGSHTYGNMSTWTSSQIGMTYNSSASAATMVTNLGLTHVAFPYSNGGSWTEYCNYVRGSTVNNGPTIPSGNPSTEPNYKYCYGLRTFVNYLLATRTDATTQNPSPLAATQTQPVYALKQAVQELDNYLQSLSSGDQVSLHSYADSAYTIQTLTSDYAKITQAVYLQSAGGRDGTNTNISAGIDGAITELTSSRARKNAKKVIFLMTDGNANLPSSVSAGEAATITYSNTAHSKGIQMYTVTLGSDANQDLMGQVASIGKGTHYHVPTFDIQQYSEDLKNVFRALGGRRPVQLLIP